MSEPVSPLAHLAPEAEAQPVAGPLIGIEETGLRGQITLRGDLGSIEIQNAVQQVMGADVPLPLTHTDGRVVWMSPDELLLLVQHDQAAAHVTALNQALTGVHHMALDVSEARAILRLTGARVGEVLAKGAPCDCSDRGFPVGTARRTHLGGLAVGIWRLDAETWEVMCFRSYAHHLMAWLEATSVPGSEVDWF